MRNNSLVFLSAALGSVVGTFWARRQSDRQVATASLVARPSVLNLSRNSRTKEIQVSTEPKFTAAERAEIASFLAATQREGEERETKGVHWFLCEILTRRYGDYQYCQYSHPILVLMRLDDPELNELFHKVGKLYVKIVNLDESRSCLAQIASLSEQIINRVEARLSYIKFNSERGSYEYGGTAILGATTENDSKTPRLK